MKKNNLFKAVGFSILALVLLSWIVPIVYSIGGWKGDVSHQIGFVSIINVILETFSGFGVTVLFILLVGGFYGVLKATGAYEKVISFLVSKSTGKEKRTLVLVTVMMTIISSITGLDFGLLIVFPILTDLLVKLGYSKYVSLAATFGATMIGMYGATIAGTLYGVNNTILGLSKFDQIGAKIALLVLGLIALLIFIFKFSNFNGTNKSDSKSYEQKKSVCKVAVSDKPRIVVILLAILFGYFGIHRFYVGKVKTGILWLLTGGLFGIGYLVDIIFIICGKFTDMNGNLVYYWTETEYKNNPKNIEVERVVKVEVSKSKKKDSDKSESKMISKEDNSSQSNIKGAVPALLVLLNLLIVFVLGTISWKDFLGVSLFENIHNSWTGVKVGGFEIFSKLFGGVDAMGTWNTPTRFQTYSLLLVIAMLAITFIYRTNIKDSFDGFVEGIKSYIVPAMLMILASSVFVFIYYNPFITPVMNSLLGATDEFNVAVSGVYTIINSLFYVDYYYLAYSVLYGITSIYDDSAVLSIISVMFANLYSLVMLLAPTSALLLVSLSISDIKYTDWFKYIWKLVVALFIISFIVFVVMLLV